MQTFTDKGLFYSAHDADTNGQEGETYTWTIDELKAVLTADEFSDFTSVYILSEANIFDGKYHLVKSKNIFLDAIEKKLLAIRKERPQPFVDRKHVTSWNALAGIGLIMAYRYCDNHEALKQAKRLFTLLNDSHMVNDRLFHSSIDGIIQQDEFLEDYASMLLFTTFLHEQTGEYAELLEVFSTKLSDFKRDSVWYETKPEVLLAVPAQGYDQPIPSSVSLAEYALLRTKILLHQPYELSNNYKEPLSFDAANLSIFVQEGNMHIIDTPEKIAWNKLPLNCIQRQAKVVQDCYQGACRSFSSIAQLLVTLKKE